MLGLHLLDSLPLSDALDVLLKQRSRSTQLLFESIESSLQPLRPGTSAERSQRKTTKEVCDVIQTVFNAITNTVGTTREVFREVSAGKPSLIKQALEALQTEGKQSTYPSLPVELRLSTQTLLSSLPNSNHFLALPSDIRSYRPFLDMRSPSSTISQSVLDGKLQNWFNKATDQLRISGSSWLGRLETIKSVWDVQTSVWAWLSSSNTRVGEENQHALSALMGDICIKRMEEIWKSALEVISATFEDEFRSSLAAVENLQQSSRLGTSLSIEFVVSIHSREFP